MIFFCFLCYTLCCLLSVQCSVLCYKQNNNDIVADTNTSIYQNIDNSLAGTRCHKWYNIVLCIMDAITSLLMQWLNVHFGLLLFLLFDLVNFQWFKNHYEQHVLSSLLLICNKNPIWILCRSRMPFRFLLQSYIAIRCSHTNTLTSQSLTILRTNQILIGWNTFHSFSKSSGLCSLYPFSFVSHLLSILLLRWCFFFLLSQLSTSLTNFIYFAR